MNYLRCQKLFIVVFKKNYFSYLFLALSVVAFVISSITRGNLNQKYIEYNSILKISDFVDNLKKNPKKHEFISKHLFADSNGADFEDFVNDAIAKNNGKMMSYKPDAEVNVGLIKKRSVTIVGLFWHDSFVFDFMNDIDLFRPGFARVVAMELEKAGEISLTAPVIEASIKCEIFQKQ
jgi:hypothetical protein